MRDIALVLAKHYPRGFKINTSELKFCTLKFASWFDVSAKTLIPFWGVYYDLDNRKSIRILGIDYTSTEDALVAMAESLI